MVDVSEAQSLAGRVGSMLAAVDDLSPFGQLLAEDEAELLRDTLLCARNWFAEVADGPVDPHSAEALLAAHRKLADRLLAAALGGDWGGGAPDVRGVLLNRLFDSSHPYLKYCEQHTPSAAPPALLQLMRRDLHCVQALAEPEWACWLRWTEPERDPTCGVLDADGVEPEAVHALRRRFDGSDCWPDLAEDLGWLVHDHGRGDLRRYGAFRLAGGGDEVRLEPIRQFADFPLDWLEGQQERIEVLEENTLSFLDGHRAHNALVWGPRGGGKSTLIRALAGKYREQNLRAVEVTPDMYERLPDLFALIRGRRQCFIGVLDNISLDRGDGSLHVLSRVLDGGLEEWPANLVFYATSNYKDLVDREGERSQGLGQMQMDDPTPNRVNRAIQPAFYDPQQLQRLDEERALDDRFALKIFLDLPRKRQYQAMVLSYARRAGIDESEEELLAAFEIWRMRHNHDLVGGRTARDFVLAYSARNRRSKES